MNRYSNRLAFLAGSALAVVLVAALVLGYVVLWAIWHFGFRGRGTEDRDADGR